MSQQILIADQLRIAAVLSNDRVDQLIVAQGQHQIGDIYLGTVQNVHPGIDAAFVNIGESERNGFIHVTDLGPLRLKQTSASITELLEPGQKAMVQVMKEPTGSKGPRLTGNLTLPGRFLLLLPSGQGVTISRRIIGEAERNRLRALGVLIKPPGTGLLVRTEAEKVGEDQIIEDLEFLWRQWEAIQSAAETCQVPALLNRDDDFVHRTLRDHSSGELEKVVVDSPQVMERVRTFLQVKKHSVSVQTFGSAEQLLDHFRIPEAIHQALLPRVNLPSGGYIIIELTEALTVIDVNSGSFTRSANARETVLWTNCEAATEIAHQLQLRNIGGMVIVDFIDMESRRDQLLLLEHFTKAMGPDKARPQIAQITELGLVELTRKRQGQNLYELFSHQCPNCSGLGHVAMLPGKGTVQSSVTGLVQTATITPVPPAVATSSDTVSASGSGSGSGSGGNGNNRRRRRGGGRSTTTTAPAETPTTPSPGAETPDSVPTTEAEGSTSPPSEPEVVAVPMNEDQEVVFSWCGLNPALMAPTPPKDLDNVVVQLVSPEEKAESLSADNKEQVANGSSRGRRRQRSGTEDSKQPEAAPEVVAEEPMDQQIQEQEPEQDEGRPSPQRRSRTRSRNRGVSPVATNGDTLTPTLDPLPETTTATAVAIKPEVGDERSEEAQPVVQTVPLDGEQQPIGSSPENGPSENGPSETSIQEEPDGDQRRRRRRPSAT